MPPPKKLKHARRRTYERREFFKELERGFHWVLNMLPLVRTLLFNWTNCSLTNAPRYLRTVFIFWI